MSSLLKVKVIGLMPAISLAAAFSKPEITQKKTDNKTNDINESIN
jgi:hypothetical protein